MINSVLKIVLFFLFIINLTSCGKSQRELAVERTELARTLLEKGDTLKALQNLDSISTLYPEATIQIGAAANFKDKIYSELIDRRKSQLEIIDTVIVSLEKNFSKEKTEFDRYAQYIPFKQAFNSSWNRSFIGVHLNEKGDLHLSSNYKGDQRLNHSSIRVYNGDLQAKTNDIPLSSPEVKQSSFMDSNWERVNYKNGASDSVIMLVANYSEENLKCVFLGEKQYFIVLEKFDKEAIKNGYELSNAIKLKCKLNAELAYYQSKRE